jgi:hypothetical protein
VLLTPISCCSIGCQFALQLVCAAVHPCWPVGIFRLLMYIHKLFYSSVYAAMGAGGEGVVRGAGVVGTIGVGSFVITGVVGRCGVAKRTFWVGITVDFFDKIDRKSAGLIGAIFYVVYTPVALDYVMAMYLSRMSSSSSITSGSSSS